MVFELFEEFIPHFGGVFPDVITFTLSLFHSFTRTDSPTGKVSHRGAPLLKVAPVSIGHIVRGKKTYLTFL